MAVAHGMGPYWREFRVSIGAWALAPMLFLCVSLALHVPVLGDWAYEVDDQFYALVGSRLTQGDTLYVDIWDRKGPALYYTFAFLAAIWPSSVVAYQLAAATCAAMTACLIARIAIELDFRKGAVPAGLAYLALLYQFGGANAQTEVFMAPLIGFCAWCVISRVDRIRNGQIDGRLCLGFVAAGVALLFKQSAVFEGMFFGAACVVLALTNGAGLSRTSRMAGVLLCSGVLPFALVSTWFLWTGHFDSLFQALVTSNVDRRYMGTGEWLKRAPVVLMEMLMPAGFAILGWLAMRLRSDRAKVNLVMGWIAAAIVPLLAYPNIFNHYLLTLLPPLCVLAGGLYARRPLGWYAVAGLALAVLPFSHALDWAERDRSRDASAQLVAYVRDNIGSGDLFVAGQISYLYVLAGKKPPTAWPFPAHLFDSTEAQATGVDQAEEVARILARKPGMVVRQIPIEGSPPNKQAIQRIDDYVRHCKRSRRFTLYNQFGPHDHAVFSGCGQTG